MKKEFAVFILPVLSLSAEVGQWLHVPTDGHSSRLAASSYSAVLMSPGNPSPLHSSCLAMQTFSLQAQGPSPFMVAIWNLQIAFLLKYL